MKRLIKWEDIQRFKCYEIATTALIKYQLSTKERKMKETAYSDAYSDMEQEYIFHKIRIFITPVIGCNAGIQYEFICYTPMAIDCISHPNIKCESNSWSDDLIYFPDSPTPKNTTQRILLSIHDYSIMSKISEYNLTPKFKKQYLKIPFLLNPQTMLIWTENNLDLNICKLMMKYLGVAEIKIHFLPNIFDSFTINILYGMTIHEINTLIQTHLFIKYTELTDLPPFHYYDYKGIQQIHSFKQTVENESLMPNNELYLLFSTKYMPNNKYNSSFLILNFVGFGFNMVENIDCNKMKTKELINMFNDTINNKDDVKDEQCVTFMFSFELSSSKIRRVNCAHEMFEAKNISQGYNTEFDSNKLWPITKTKKCVHVNYDKYEKYKRLSLKDINLNLDENNGGLLVNMYAVSGPCICISYYWMKADVIFFPSYLYADINLEWPMPVYCNYMSNKTGYTFSMKYMKKTKRLIDTIKDEENMARRKANNGKPPQCTGLCHY